VLENLAETMRQHGGGARGVVPPDQHGGGARGVVPPDQHGGGARGVVPPGERSQVGT